MTMSYDNASSAEAMHELYGGVWTFVETDCVKNYTSSQLTKGSATTFKSGTSSFDFSEFSFYQIKDQVYMQGRLKFFTIAAGSSPYYYVEVASGFPPTKLNYTSGSMYTDEDVVVIPFRISSAGMMQAKVKTATSSYNGSGIFLLTCTYQTRTHAFTEPQPNSNNTWVRTE